MLSAAAGVVDTPKERGRGQKSQVCARAMVCRRLWPGPRDCSRLPAISELSILTRLPGDPCRQSAAQKTPGSRVLPFFSSWTRAHQGLVLRLISCPPCDGVWGTVSRTRNHVDGGLAEQGDRNSQKGHRPGQRGGENGGT